MYQPVVKKSGVVLYLPPIGKRDILTLLMNPIIYGTEPKTTFNFEQFDKVGDKGGATKTLAKLLVEFGWGQTSRNAKGRQVMGSPPEFFGCKLSRIRVRVKSATDQL